MLNDITQCLQWVSNLSNPSASSLRQSIFKGRFFFLHYEQSFRFTVGPAVGLVDVSFLVVKKSHCNNLKYSSPSKSTNSIKQSRSFACQHLSIYRLINFVSFHSLGSYCYADKVRNTQMIENLSLLINTEVLNSECMLHSYACHYILPNCQLR